jgi:cysteine desulfurase/selenocysteine lyase
MSTPTPTADGAGVLPAWIPDEAALASLASALYGPLGGAAQEVNPAEGATVSQPADGAMISRMEPDTLSPVESGPVEAGHVESSHVESSPVESGPGGFGLVDALPVTPNVTRQFQSGLAMPSVPGFDMPGMPGPSGRLPAPSPGPFSVTAPAGAAMRLESLVPAVPAGPAVPASEPPASIAGLDPWIEVIPSAAPVFYFISEAAQSPGEVGPDDAGPDEPARHATAQPLDVEGVRRDFPILAERVNGRPLVWMDNAATTQKPRAVIDRLGYFYAHENSNVHRGAHALATRATDAYEGARSTVATYLGASSASDIVFTRGTTEAINLVARAWGGKHVGPGDEIVLSHLEHHANIVPWQRLAAASGAKLRIIPVGDDGQVLVDEFAALLSERTRIVAVAHVSNVLGTIVPVAQIIEAAHRAGACVLVDGAQAVAHMPVDVQALDADFYVFSGHKVFGPTGIGALYGKPELLQDMPPWQGGGNMILDVTFERTVYQEAPAKFEAGTGNIADAAGLATALDYVSVLGLPAIERYEHELLQYAMGELTSVPGLRLIGTAPDKASVLTFVLDGHQPEAVGDILDKQGIAVRAGHHCAQPILRRYGLEAAVRPSLAMYNTHAEVDLLVHTLRVLASSTTARRPV